VELFAVGKIVGCFGIRGVVKVQPFTHSHDRFMKLRTIIMGHSEKETTCYDVQNVELKNGSIMFTFEGISDRTAAEKLVGNFLFVEKDDLDPPKQGSYFVHDIVGSSVTTDDGKFLGTVEDVYKLSTQDVWVIRNGDKEVLIPAVKEFIVQIDPAKKAITVRVIKGLIDE
jgi:16S rRNA processing protein RimM